MHIVSYKYCIINKLIKIVTEPKTQLIPSCGILKILKKSEYCAKIIFV